MNKRRNVIRLGRRCWWRELLAVALVLVALFAAGFITDIWRAW